jgi:exodeoxyribonuclease VII large subunit
MLSSPPSLFDQSPSDAAWTIGRLMVTAKQVLERGMQSLWVQGEVSGFKSYRSGHWYFTLRDADAQVRCVMWRDDARRVRQEPAEGATVFAYGAPSLWPERGEFRFTVKRLIRTEGLGLQQALVEETRATLAAEGLLDAGRKRRLPAMPCAIALVTSADGAVLHDVVAVARKRWPLVRILVIGTRVQGDGAAAEVIHALQRAERLPGIDLCIVARGGGAREDLAVFNDLAVCRALAALSVPTISAVGHETDVSLTDLVADVRAPTPSAAAEMALADQEVVRHQVDALANRLAGGLRSRTRLASERLGRAADRLGTSLDRSLRDRRARADRLGVALDALSPLRTLERGYSMALSPTGQILKRHDQFFPGDTFRLRVADGEVPARVEEA